MNCFNFHECGVAACSRHYSHLPPAVPVVQVSHTAPTFAYRWPFGPTTLVLISLALYFLGGPIQLRTLLSTHSCSLRFTWPISHLNQPLVYISLTFSTFILSLISQVPRTLVTWAIVVHGPIVQYTRKRRVSSLCIHCTTPNNQSRHLFSVIPPGLIALCCLYLHLLFHRFVYYTFKAFWHLFKIFWPP